MVDKVVRPEEDLLLRANRMCEWVENTIEEIGRLSRNLDMEFKRCHSSKKSTSAQSADTVVKSAEPFLLKAISVQESKPEGQR